MIEMLRRNESCPQESGCDGLAHHVNLPTEFNLKYLEIRDCSYGNAVQDSSVSFVRKQANQIQYLKVYDLLAMKEILDRNDDQCFKFPGLKELTITLLPRYEEADKKVLINMVRLSPNLKIILVEDGDIFDIIPEEHFGLVGNLNLDLELLDRHRKLLERFLQHNAKLRRLTIDLYFPPTFNILQRHIIQLFQSSSESLQELKIDYTSSSNITDLLSRFRFQNLSKFSCLLHYSRKRTTAILWKFLQLINEIMPKLEEFGLGLVLDRNSGPVISHEGLDFTPSKAQKLKLKLSGGSWRLVEIKGAFPHVTSLEMDLYDFGPLPCGEIWEMWPKLEELKISGSQITLTRNYDADFCGIHEEEASQLRKMDENYIRAVHLVPIRPSLLTMKRKYLNENPSRGSLCCRMNIIRV